MPGVLSKCAALESVNGDATSSAGNTEGVEVRTAPVSSQAPKAAFSDDFRFPPNLKIEVKESKKKIYVSLTHNGDAVDRKSTLDSIVRSLDEAEKHVRIVSERLENSNECLRAIQASRVYADEVVNREESKGETAIHEDGPATVLDPRRMMVTSRIILSLAKNLEELLLKTVAGEISLKDAELALGSVRYLHAFMAKTVKEEDKARAASFDPDQPGTSSDGVDEQWVSDLISENLWNQFSETHKVVLGKIRRI